MLDREALAKLCLDATLPDDGDEEIAIREPYIPHIPPQWNGILLLAEAQNHAGANRDYVAALKELEPEERVRRLDVPLPGREGRIGVQPWDDGTLKLAVAAAFGDDAVQQTAVSNAVLWSRRSADEKQNLRPSPSLVTASVALWTRIIKAMQPGLVVAAGQFARDVMRGAEFARDRLLLWQSPSPQYVSRVSTCLFRWEDLKAAFPEVDASAIAHADWLDHHEPNKRFYACHAVSMTRHHEAQFGRRWRPWNGPTAEVTR